MVTVILMINLSARFTVQVSKAGKLSSPSFISNNHASFVSNQHRAHWHYGKVRRPREMSAWLSAEGKAHLAMARIKLLEIEVSA